MPTDKYNPDYYTRGGIETLDFILAKQLDFCEGNIVKYVVRWKEKGGLDDLKKAKKYLDTLIESVGNKEERYGIYPVSGRELDVSYSGGQHHVQERGYPKNTESFQGVVQETRDCDKKHPYPCLSEEEINDILVNERLRKAKKGGYFDVISELRT